MFGSKRRLPAAVLAGGLAAFVAMAGCGGEQSIASKSAAAFREAQKKGETFEDASHSHGHGAMTPGGPGGRRSEAGASTAAADHANHANPEEAPPGHGHSAMGHGSQAHAGHAGMDHGQSHQRHAEPGRTAGQDEHAGHEGQAGQTGHTGHAAMPPQAPSAGGQAPSGGHAGHSPARGGMAPGTSVAASETVPPGQPAKTLNPDELDAPAATSVADAQRSAEIAEEMTGTTSAGGHEGHAGHGGGTYVHVDAGRETGAPEGAHDHHGHGMAEEAEEAAEVYVCPMHPEVTSSTPGKCPKCGMDLVKRRKK